MSVQPQPGERWRSEAALKLRDAGLRSGAVRAGIIDLLSEQTCCLAALDIYDRLRAGGRKVSLSSVYRGLESLVELGLVQRLELGTAGAMYEAVVSDGDHHHHAVCVDCGRVMPFDDSRLEREIDRVSELEGYHVDRHELVLIGHCTDCTF